MITEESGHLIPGRNQVRPIAAGDVDGGLQHVPERRPGLLQGDPQIAQRLAHLRPDVGRRDDLPLLIEWAGARGEDQVRLVGPGGVGIGGTGEQPGTADELHGHATGVCHAAARRSRHLVPGPWDLLGSLSPLAAATWLQLAAGHGERDGITRPRRPTWPGRRAAKTVDELLAQARATLPDRPSPAEALQAQASGALLIDIREDDQRREDGLIPGAIVLPRNSLEWRCDPASEWRHPAITRRDLRIILICNQGYQSSLAAATLQQFGLIHATDLDGGFTAWAAAGLPVIAPAAAGHHPPGARPPGGQL